MAALWSSWRCSAGKLRRRSWLRSLPLGTFSGAWRAADVLRAVPLATGELSLLLITLLTAETVSLGKSKLTRYRLVLPLLLLLCLPLLDNHRNMANTCRGHAKINT